MGVARDRRACGSAHCSANDRKRPSPLSPNAASNKHRGYRDPLLVANSVKKVCDPLTLPKFKKKIRTIERLLYFFPFFRDPMSRGI